MNKHTSEEIATDWELWGEYADPERYLTIDEFNTFSTEEKVAMMDACLTSEDKARMSDEAAEVVPRVEIREVLEIIIVRKMHREAHRFILHSNSVKFGDLEFLDQQYEIMEAMLKLKFKGEKYQIQAFGLVEQVNVVIK